MAGQTPTPRRVRTQPGCCRGDLTKRRKFRCCEPAPLVRSRAEPAWDGPRTGVPRTCCPTHRRRPSLTTPSNFSTPRKPAMVADPFRCTATKVERTVGKGRDIVLAMPEFRPRAMVHPLGIEVHPNRGCNSELTPEQFDGNIGRDRRMDWSQDGEVVEVVVHSPAHLLGERRKVACGRPRHFAVAARILSQRLIDIRSFYSCLFLPTAMSSL